MSEIALLIRLETFLVQSRQLLVLAQEDDWEEFEVLMIERQKNLSALGESGFLIELTKADLVTEAKNLINAIREIDTQILESAERSKTDISAKLRQALQANKAIVAYKS